MFFDDRLATVLRQRAQSDTTRRTQFRQLLDLLGAQVSGARQAVRDPSLVAAAWLRLDSLSGAITSDDRARMIREKGWRFRNPELAAYLADFEPDVAAAALSRAQLSEDDWSALIPRLPVRARGFLRLRRDLPIDVEKLLEQLGVYDRGLPQPTNPIETEQVADQRFDTDSASEPLVLSEEDSLSSLESLVDFDGDPTSTSEVLPDPLPDPQAEGRSEISALVERIAQFRRAKEGAQAFGEDASLMPRLPLGEEHAQRSRKLVAFGFVADAKGRIEWAEPEVAAMVIGTRLFAPAMLTQDRMDNPIGRAFNRRQPIFGAATSLSGADAITGDWIVDAEPRFTESGSFVGYLGRFRRLASEPEGSSQAEREADRLRQLLHELRTPITAIQGYSEVIQQQLFGSAPHEYRALAAAIASDAARILSGFEELDRLAKLETGSIEIDAGEADIAALAERTLHQLAQVLAPRMAGIELKREKDTPQLAAIDRDDSEALLWRLLATLGGGCTSGEILDAQLECKDDTVQLTCQLPEQLLDEEDIFAAEARPVGTAINPGLFGAGFALRLARAEARAGGGDLVRVEDKIVLSLPSLRPAASSNEPPHIATESRS